MDMPVSTPVAIDLNATFARLRDVHLAKPPDYKQRMDDLVRLRSAFKSQLGDLTTAMSADFGRRSRHESLLSDGMTVLQEIDHLRRHLRGWMRPRRAAADWLYWPARTELRYQPLGVVGIIAPWNYPLNLSLIPLITAIAAGNHVMLKPSEFTPRTSQMLADLLTEVFPPERLVTALGGADVAAQFSSLPFDHLFFTGSTAVGRLVMAAAAKNLTPVTLELGGKSPVILAPDYPLATAVDRIAYGKFLNAGQTCIAPDYTLITRDRVGEFVEAMRSVVVKRYADLAAGPDFTSIVNDGQYRRLVGYLDQARAKGAQVIELAPGDAARRILPPTIVIGADDTFDVMQNEIFGPILPLVAVDSVDAAVDYVNARPRPLALYVFDNDAKRVERVLQRTISGGASVNDTLLQILQSELPFGGVGPAGMGHYHGHEGFLTFTKQKPVFYQARWSGMALMRPPYGKLMESMLKFLTR